MATQPLPAALFRAPLAGVFLKCSTRKKDGKEHRSWSIVESRRGGRSVGPRHVPYLGEINDSQRAGWQKSIAVFAEQAGQSRPGALFPGDRTPAADTRPNEGWSYDFVSDQTADGRRLRYLCVVDEFTRECLALEVRRNFPAAAVLTVLAALAALLALRSAPAYLRSDNGPEFVARAVQAWLKAQVIGPLYIAPGSPWENAYVESFNSRLRDEHLNREEFTSLLEAKVLSAGWRRDYNEARPHSSLEYLAPAVFAARWRGNPATMNQNSHSNWINKRELASA